MAECNWQNWDMDQSYYTRPQRQSSSHGSPRLTHGVAVQAIDDTADEGPAPQDQSLKPNHPICSWNWIFKYLGRPNLPRFLWPARDCVTRRRGLLAPPKVLVNEKRVWKTLQGLEKMPLPGAGGLVKGLELELLNVDPCLSPPPTLDMVILHSRTMVLITVTLVYLSVYLTLLQH